MSDETFASLANWLENRPTTLGEAKQAEIVHALREADRLEDLISMGWFPCPDSVLITLPEGEPCNSCANCKLNDERHR